MSYQHIGQGGRLENHSIQLKARRVGHPYPPGIATKRGRHRGLPLQSHHRLRRICCHGGLPRKIYGCHGQKCVLPTLVLPVPVKSIFVFFLRQPCWHEWLPRKSLQAIEKSWKDPTAASHRSGMDGTPPLQHCSVGVSPTLIAAIFIFFLRRLRPYG